MLELLTTEEMARADELTITAGTPGTTLMDAAGRAVAHAVTSTCPDGPVLVLAGPGNNGGDGFVAARVMAGAGRTVTLMLLGPADRLKSDAAIACERWHGPIVAAACPLPDAAVIVDALFGAGLDREVTGHAADLVAAMNAHPAPVVAVDLPSGLSSVSGRPLGCCVEAAATVTFFRKKPGHLLEPGRSLCGHLHLAQIGIRAEVLAEIRPGLFENAPGLWRHDFPVPGPAGHKYDRGHALVVSGPMSQTGAARLAAGAALRAGAGLVTLASAGSALAVNAAHLTAIMLRRTEDAAAIAELLSDRRFTSVALGPGLGIGNRERAIVEAALASATSAILDADALTVFADDPEALFALIRARDRPTVLTPHAGEFARLFPDLAVDAEPRTVRTREAARRSGAVLVLKGADTVVASPDGRASINANAPPWLATAGSGDVLTGILAGLTAQGMAGFEAACAAVWMHGAAGSQAGPGLIAEDLAPALRPVIAGLYEPR